MTEQTESEEVAQIRAAVREAGVSLSIAKHASGHYVLALDIPASKMVRRLDPYRRVLIAADARSPLMAFERLVARLEGLQ